MNKFMELMKNNEFLRFLKGNIYWIKDVFWILFTFLAAIISFRTYKKNKNDVFIPLRGEVIKRQTDLLLELLCFISNINSENELFNNKVDYQNIIRLNFILNLESIGIIFKDQNIIKKAEEEIYLTMVKKEAADEILSIVKVMDTETSSTNSDENSKVSLIDENKEKFQNENFDFPLIYLTEKHYECNNILQNIINNPLLPKEIKLKLELIVSDIEENLGTFISKALNKSFKELINSELYLSLNNKDSKNDGNERLSPSGAYNNFLDISINHDDLINKIIIDIRSYLKIDNIWD